MVVMAGANHIEERDGIPDRIAKRVSRNLARRENEEGGSSRPSAPRWRAQQVAAAKESFRGVHTVVPKSVTFPVPAEEFPQRAYADFVWFVERDAGFEDGKVNRVPTQVLVS